MSNWLKWAQQLQAIAQIGLTYAENGYDRERYEQIRDLAVEMAATNADAMPAVVRAMFTHDRGYVTPKVDVRGAAFHEDRVLLVREARDGLWTLPGGWADVGDSPAEAVEREILEESGYEARAIKLGMVYDRDKHHPPHEFHIYKLFFVCEVTGGEATKSLETDGVDWFLLDNLPPLSQGRTIAPEITRLYDHYRAPALATDFD